MKANELRIGNYILDNGTVETVYQLQSLAGDTINEDDYCANFKPIPITEEWLVNFGFEHEIINGSMKYVLGIHDIYYIEGFIFRLFGTNDHDCQVETNTFTNRSYWNICKRI